MARAILHCLLLLSLSAVVACAARNDDGEAAARALVEKRLGTGAAIQSITLSADQATACGYATVTKPSPFPGARSTFLDTVPFIVQDGRLTLLSEDAKDFISMQRHCPEAWVAPRPQPGIS